jgi:hypothetical protein
MNVIIKNILNYTLGFPILLISTIIMLYLITINYFPKLKEYFIYGKKISMITWNWNDLIDLWRPLK